MAFIKLDEKYIKTKQYELVPDQIEGVEFLMNRAKALLAFQTGLGKTLTSLVALKVLLDRYESARGIIVCPVKAVKIFKKELREKLELHEIEIGVISTQEMEYDEAVSKVFIFTDTVVAKYRQLIVDLEKRYKLILIVDEAHKLQDNKSAYYKTMAGGSLDENGNKMKGIREYCTAMWLSTATPVLNDLESLYNIVAFLDKSIFRTKTDFLNKYTISRLKDIYVKGGAKRKVREILGINKTNLPELQAKLADICIMRQKQYNLRFTDVSGELTPKESEIYEKVSAGIMGDEERNFSQRMHDLQRFVDNAYQEELINEDGSTKERLLIETLTTIVSKDYSTVVYVDYLDTIERLTGVLYSKKREIGFNNIYEIKGSIGIKEREAIEDKIGKRDIIIVTRAGTESINLQKANCVAMFDIPYSVKDCIQLIGRVTRMDTEYDKQFILVIWTKGTIDEYKYLLFKDNATIIKQVLGSDATLPVDIQELDKKNLQALKDKMLWHFKGTAKKELNSKKRLLKSNIVVCDSTEYMSEIGTHFVNLNPLGSDLERTKRLNDILPKEEDYRGYIDGKIPKSVFRSRYVDLLKTDKGKAVLTAIVSKILEGHTTSKRNGTYVIVLVDDYGVGETLKNYILDNVKLD